MAGGEVSTLSISQMNWVGSSTSATAAFVFRKMSALLSSLWLCITVSVLFLTKIVAARVLRVKTGEGVGEEGVSTQKEECPSMSAEGSSFFQQIFHEEDREWREENSVDRNIEESSSLEFKFGFQISDSNRRKGEEALETSQFLDESVEDKSKSTTKVHNYRFVSEKGFIGFIQVPESKTFSIHESYVDDQHNENARPYDTELLDRELKDRFSSVKCFDQQIQHCSDEEVVVLEHGLTETVKQHRSLEKSESVGSNLKVKPGDEDTVKELKDNIPSVNSLDHQVQGCLDEEAVVLEHDVSEGVKQDPSLEKPESVGSNEDVKASDDDNAKEPMIKTSQTKLLSVDREVFANDGIQTTPRDSESSVVFDLDSISISSSDGYSIKDLTADYDSDDLISERDLSFQGSEDLDSEKEIEGTEKELEELLSDDEQSRPTEKSRDLNAGIEQDKLLSDDIDYKASAHFTDNSDKQPTEKSRGLNSGIELDKLLSDDDADKASVHFTDNFEKQMDESFLMESQEKVKNLVEEITNKAAAVIRKIHLEHLDFETQYFKDDKSRLSSTEDGFPGSTEFDEEFIDLGTEKVSFFVNQTKNLNSSEHNFSDKDMLQYDKKGETEQRVSSGTEHDYSEESNSKKHEGVNKEEEDELESLWEHQDLIEQLKMDLKKAKSIGLPTIHEESESLKMMEDLKPWKIDVELMHKDPMDELNKLYNSYKERMRKFDILNYQKMYSIGCLKLKEPLKSIGNYKPAITSIFSENFWPCSRRKSNDDPSQIFIRELQNDLENVYVGQMCLSWEILWWQFEKVLELFESDHYSSQRYNQVAGEFQQLQVVIQRFLEDEPFQCARRLTYYVQSRCVNRGLLQVPLLREDSVKDNKAETISQPSSEVTMEDLRDMMQKIIKLFWQFVKSDKDIDAPSVMKGLGLVRIHVELQDPTDTDLLQNIRDNLQKKENKLKDLLKVGNCLVKKFKKPQEGRLSKDMFYSQVDMKLISRALTMPKISTDQLLWCHKKLSKINFVNRRLHREPAFLLFPC